MALAVRLDDVGKRYRKYEDNPLLISTLLQLRRATRHSTIWAARHVELEVEQGECVGVIGRNGSGKSTILQLLAGVSAPTEGRVTVRGRVAPLLAVGVGFSNELTGRENIYLNGTILGLSREQIDAALDEIIAFAEIDSFIDTPVKFYSSGMTVRLGFAVAAQARPDVLLLDEVLAVGDIAFQMKCFDRMAEVIQSGATVLLVSHNLSAVRRLCSRTLVLHNGVQRFLGRTDDALHDYQLALAENPVTADEARDDASAVRVFPGIARVADVDVAIDDGVVAIRVALEVEQRWEAACLAIMVRTKGGVPVFFESSADIGPLDPGRQTWSAQLATPLAGGDYSVTVALRSLDPLGRLDLAPHVDLTVPPQRGITGVVDLGGRLRVQPNGQ